MWDDTNGQVGLGPHLASPITRVHTTAISDLPRPTNTISARDFLRANLRRVGIIALEVSLAAFATFSGVYFLVIYLHEAGVLPVFQLI